MSRIKQYVNDVVTFSSLAPNYTDKFTVSLDEFDGRRLEALCKLLDYKKTVLAREFLKAAITDAEEELNLHENDEYRNFVYSDKPMKDFKMKKLVADNKDE